MLQKTTFTSTVHHVVLMRGSRGDLISPILLEMKKISYFSYLCTSSVIRQTESILLKVGSPPPLENFSLSVPVDVYIETYTLTAVLNLTLVILIPFLNIIDPSVLSEGFQLRENGETK